MDFVFRLVEPAGEPRQPVALFERPRPLRKLVVAMIARRGEVSLDVAERALAAYEVESDRPFLDWLTNGGLEKLIEIILKLLPLFV